MGRRYFFRVLTPQAVTAPMAAMPVNATERARAGANKRPKKNAAIAAPAPLVLDGATHTPADALAAACGVAPADSALLATETASLAALVAGLPGMARAGVFDLRRQARQMYWRGFRITAIADALDVKRTTLQSWAKAEGWSKAKPQERTLGTLEVRLVNLIEREHKTGADFKEIDLLGRQMERLGGGAAAFGLGADGSRIVPDHIGRLPAAGAEPGEPGEQRRRVRSATRKPDKNHFEPEHVQTLVGAFLDGCFGYQKRWFDGIGERVRLILKSRQIGATWYFAREALIDLLQSARTQVFLSASRAQAYQFRNYQRNFVREVLDMDLEGDPIVFSNGAREFFLGRNVATAQGYAGNLYFDEIYWVPNFGTMESTAGAIATHKRFRKTYFSTPSVVTHDAYDLWTGERFNTGRAKAEQVAIDLAHKKLVKGHRGGDGIWRNVVTIEDAVAQGLNLVDLEQLKRENAPQAYRNLYLCEFVDDAQAVFPYAWLQPCAVDSIDAWAGDWQPFAPRPFGFKGVWVGYDPSGGGDACGLVVVAPPDKPGGKFRVLEFHRLAGDDFAEQAEFIRQVTQRYTVLKMGIDVTGLGQGVYQLVQKFYPLATPIHYSVETKSALVMRAQNVLRNGRMEWDMGGMQTDAGTSADLVQSFMAIKHQATRGGQLSYASGRRKNTGHADLAWALMNALSFEPLTGAAPAPTIVRAY